MTAAPARHHFGTREVSPEELKAIAERVSKRVARLSELTRLGGELSADALEGLIAFAAAALVDPRALVGCDRARAEEALAYALPGDTF